MFDSAELRDELQALKNDVSRLLNTTGEEIFDTSKSRAEALADLTGFDRNALAAAIYHPGLRSPQELRSTIGLLEAARRMVQQPRFAR